MPLWGPGLGHRQGRERLLWYAGRSGCDLRMSGNEGTAQSLVHPATPAIDHCLRFYRRQQFSRRRMILYGCMGNAFGLNAATVLSNRAEQNRAALVFGNASKELLSGLDM